MSFIQTAKDIFFDDSLRGKIFPTYTLRNSYKLMIYA